MGVVYRAWDEALRRPLAVKRLPPGKHAAKIGASMNLFLKMLRM